MEATTGRLPANAGDVWTWVAIDPETKLVPCWRVGDRSQEMANEFIADLARRLTGRVQITAPYIEASSA